MPSLANSGVHLLRRLLGAPERGPRPHAGSPTILDGNAAVAHTEAGICEAAGIGTSFPADAAGLAWRLEQRRLRVNAFGAPLGSHETEGPRGALAAAIGLTLTGARATCFLAAPDLAGCRDLLTAACARRLPLVMHLVGRGDGGPGAVLGNSQHAFHIGADAGCVVLVAANVQEAIDFTLIARRVCEQALLPAVVAMDGPQTALALQDVCPASARLIRDLLGDPRDRVSCPDAAQQMLFGEQRRRVPSWHDGDRPVMLGALQPFEAAGPGRAAARAYLDPPVDAVLDAAITRFGELTGRDYRSLSEYRLDDATLVLLTMGSAIETAEAAADRLRARHRLRVGVIGVRRLHPFPGAELARLLGRKVRVCVLECEDLPLADEPPLLRQLRASLGRARDNHDHGADSNPGYPALAVRDHPRLVSVIHGLGGMPLRAADLLHLCRDAAALERPRVYLGVDFSPTAGGYPKRQVLLDHLRRAYPQAADLGVKADAAGEDLRPDDSVTLAIRHRSGGKGDGLIAEAAALLHRIDGGGVRGRPALFVQAWGQICVDRVTSSARPLRDPGDDCPVDLLLLLTDQDLPTPGAPTNLAANATLLVQTALPEERLWARLPAAERKRLKDGAASLYLVPPPPESLHAARAASGPASSPGTVRKPDPEPVPEPDPELVPEPAPEPAPDVSTHPTTGAAPGPSAESAPVEAQVNDRHGDYLLGAVCALLLERGLMDLTRRRLLGLRADMLRQAVADVDPQLRLFEAGLDAPRRIDAARLPRNTALGVADAVDEPPALVRRIGGKIDGFDSLPRFWDRVGVLYRNGDTDAISPDPVLGIGAVPALSAGFRDLSPLRERLPGFDPDLCTVCGACWSACPESAIAAVAITPAQMLDAGIKAGGADALRPLASKLAAGVAQLCLQAEYAPSTAAELLDSAYAQLEPKLPFPPERKQAMTAGLRDLITAIGAAPVVASDALFAAPESASPGTGALLAWGLNPDTCKACGICVAVCTPGALRNERQGNRALTEARQLYAAWERLPNTEPAILQRAAALPEPGALAAWLLDRRAAHAMVGGDGAEPGSGARLALRLTIAALAASQASVAAELLRDLDNTRKRIAALLRDTLADALPARDLDALSERLSGVASRQADLGELLGPAGEAVDAAVDAARLRRLVDLARDLGDWAWRLREGSNGLGRAGFGIVLSPGAAVGWAGAFPDNPFGEPVVLDWSGDGAQLAAGLLEGQLRRATRDLALLRKARLELERPADAARLWADLDGLSWHDLDPEELARCPSLLLVGDGAGPSGSLVGSAGASLGGVGLPALHRLLGTDLPLRVLLLADLDAGLGTRAGSGLPAAGPADAAIDFGLLAISRRDAYVAQSCIAEPGHLAASLRGAFRHRGPAVVHLHAPSPRRHGFATERTLERARAAVLTRMFPLFRYDPSAEGVFGSRIDLADNPDPGDAWATGPDGLPATPAHWCAGEARFADLLRPLADDAPEPTPLGDYLALPQPERGKRTPFITRAANGAAPRRLRVDDALVRLCLERRQAWRVLQELAGLVTPFTARIRREAEERVAAERQAEIAALTADYERRIDDLRADHLQELRADIRDRLMALAGYGRTAHPLPQQAQPETVQQRSAPSRTGTLQLPESSQ